MIKVLEIGWGKRSINAPADGIKPHRLPQSRVNGFNFRGLQLLIRAAAKRMKPLSFAICDFPATLVRKCDAVCCDKKNPT